MQGNLQLLIILNKLISCACPAIATRASSAVMMVCLFIFLSFLFVSFLWLLRESITDGEEGVAAHGVGPSLGAALGVDVIV